MSNDQQPPHYPQPQYLGDGRQGQPNPQHAQNSGGMPPSKPKSQSTSGRGSGLSSPSSLWGFSQVSQEG